LDFVKRLTDYIRGHKYVLFLLYIPVYLLCYFLVERHVPSDSAYWVSYMPFDDKIPFLDFFVVPYIMWYPFLIAVGLYLMVKDPPVFVRYALFLIIGFSVSIAICWVFPNGQELRPARFEHDNIFTRIISSIYAADTNTNVFPSMHVVGMLGGTFAVFASDKARRLRLPSVILAVLVSASTVFIKQHSFLDIIGGVLLSLPLYWGLFAPPGRVEKRRVTGENKQI
jgi:membrane-associated phospholipid phosphatase